MERHHYIGVIGAGSCSDEAYQIAVNLGFEIGTNTNFLDTSVSSKTN